MTLSLSRMCCQSRGERRERTEKIFPDLSWVLFGFKSTLCLEQLVIAYCGAIKIFSINQNKPGQAPRPLLSPPSNHTSGHLSRSLSLSHSHSLSLSLLVFCTYCCIYFCWKANLVYLWVSWPERVYFFLLGFFLLRSGSAQQRPRNLLFIKCDQYKI